MPPQGERIAGLEARIKILEADMTEFHSTCQEIRNTLSELVATKEAEKAVNGDRRRRKMDLKDWIIVLTGAGTVLSPFLLPLLK